MVTEINASVNSPRMPLCQSKAGPKFILDLMSIGQFIYHHLVPLSWAYFVSLRNWHGPDRAFKILRVFVQDKDHELAEAFISLWFTGTRYHHRVFVQINDLSCAALNCFNGQLASGIIHEPYSGRVSEFTRFNGYFHGGWYDLSWMS